jgi:hypothetical protein
MSDADDDIGARCHGVGPGGSIFSYVFSLVEKINDPKVT